MSGLVALSQIQKGLTDNMLHPELHCFIVFRDMYVNFYFNIILYLLKNEKVEIQLYMLAYNPKTNEAYSPDSIILYFPSEYRDRIQCLLFQTKEELIYELEKNPNKKSVYLFVSDYRTTFPVFKSLSFVQDGFDFFLFYDLKILQIANHIWLFNSEWKKLFTSFFLKVSGGSDNILEYEKKIRFFGVKNTLGISFFNKEHFRLQNGLNAKKYVLFIPTEHYPFETDYKVISFDRNIIGFLKTAILKPTYLRYLKYSERRLFNKLHSYCQKNGYEIITKFRRKINVRLSKNMIKKSAHVFYDEHDCPATLLSLISISTFGVLFYKSTVVYEMTRLSLPVVTVNWKREMLIDDILDVNCDLDIYNKGQNKLMNPGQFLTYFKT